MMDDRFDICPDCGGWLTVDDNRIFCDSCEAEWDNGIRIDSEG